VQERVVRAKLNEVAQQICPYCWGILQEVFGGEGSAKRIEEEQKAEHSVWECWRLLERGESVQQQLDSVRRWIYYSREVDVCWKCGMIQKLCEWESGEQQQQQKCSWNNIVVPVLYGLLEAAAARRQLDGDRADTVLGRSGYDIGVEESRENRDRRFGQWIGQKHIGRRVLGRVVSNGAAVVVGAIVAEAAVAIE
jgi:hypothetical protein